MKLFTKLLLITALIHSGTAYAYDSNKIQKLYKAGDYAAAYEMIDDLEMTDFEKANTNLKEFLKRKIANHDYMKNPRGAYDYLSKVEIYINNALSKLNKSNTAQVSEFVTTYSHLIDAYNISNDRQAIDYAKENIIIGKVNNDLCTLIKDDDNAKFACEIVVVSNYTKVAALLLNNNNLDKNNVVTTVKSNIVDATKALEMLPKDMRNSKTPPYYTHFIYYNVLADLYYLLAKFEIENGMGNDANTTKYKQNIVLLRSQAAYIEKESSEAYPTFDKWLSGYLASDTAIAWATKQ